MGRRQFWVVGFVVFVAFFDLFIQFPVVSPYTAQLGASGTLVGLVVGAYSAANLFGNVASGVFLDRWGRKTPVLIGLIIASLALLGYVVAQTPWQLLLARAVHGLSTAVLTPGAFAMLGDLSAPGRRARVMGVNGALIAIAAVTGPPIAGVLRDRVGFGAVFIMGATLMLVAAALFALLARETIGHARASETGARPARVDYWSLWTRPALVASYTTVLAFTVGLGMLVNQLPLLLTARGEPARSSGLAFTIYALVALVVMAGPLNRLSDRLGRFKPMAGGLALMGMGMLSLATVAGTSGVALGMGVFGLGFGLLFPAASALVAEAARADERGAAFGIFYGIYSLGVVIGSVASGVMNDVLRDLSGAPFVVGGTVALVFAPLILLLGRRVLLRAEARSSA